MREALRKRAHILATLRGTPHEKPELVEQLSVSRSTIDRGIDELESAELVDRSEEGYYATVAGALALDAHRAYTEETDSVKKVAPILNTLPDSSVIDPVMLRGCTVSFPDTHAPENALQPVVAALEDADRFCGLAPLVKSGYVTLLHEAVFERGLTVEIVVDQKVRDSLSDLTVVERELEALAASDRFQFLETDERLPYALWTMEGEHVTAGITVYDSGSIAGVLLNDRRPAVEWSNETYRSFRSSATPVDIEFESA